MKQEIHRAKVVVADDHTIVRDGLISLLQEQFDVVAGVTNGSDLVRDAVRLKPDVVVTDLAMPGLDGLDALRQMRRDGFDGKVIVLTMHCRGGIAAELIRAGASGFLLKTAAADELVIAIQEVLQGRVYLTPAITKDVLASISKESEAGRRELTPRQRDVLRLIVKGYQMKEIAARLQLSTRTVETHKYEMMHALGFQSTVELVRYALENDLAGP